MAPLLALGLLTLGAVGISGCDDDGDNGMVVDAGPDGPRPACKPSDCAGQPMPMHMCMNGSRASYVCARGFVETICVWTQPTCAPDGSDAGDGPNSEVGDGGVDDDALDAPLVGDGAID